MSQFTKLYKDMKHMLEKHKTEIEIALAALALAAAMPAAEMLIEDEMSME